MILGMGVPPKLKPNLQRMANPSPGCARAERLATPETLITFDKHFRSFK